MRRFLFLLDCWANVTLFVGRHFQTISARSGYALYRGKRWARVAVPLIDAFFGKNHCIEQAWKEGLLTWRK